MALMRFQQRSLCADLSLEATVFNSMGQAHRRMEDWILVASEDATAGSVMAKQDLISPFSSGSSHACSITSLL